jgi:hypothetical protein
LGSDGGGGLIDCWSVVRVLEIRVRLDKTRFMWTFAVSDHVYNVPIILSMVYGVESNDFG